MEQQLARALNIKKALGQSNARLTTFIKTQQDGFNAANSKLQARISHAEEALKQWDKIKVASRSTAEDRMVVLERQAGEARTEIESLRMHELWAKEQDETARAEIVALRSRNDKLQQDAGAAKRTEQLLRNESEGLRKGIIALNDVHAQETLRRDALNHMNDARQELKGLSIQHHTAQHSAEIWEARATALIEEREAALEQLRDLDAKYFSARVWQRHAKDREVALKQKSSRVRQLLRTEEAHKQQILDLQGQAKDRTQNMTADYEELRQRDHSIAKLQRKIVSRRKLKHQIKVLEDEKHTSKEHFDALCAYYRHLYAGTSAWSRSFSTQKMPKASVSRPSPFARRSTRRWGYLSSRSSRVWWRRASHHLRKATLRMRMLM